jgi:hypothetical protein
VLTLALVSGVLGLRVLGVPTRCPSGFATVPAVRGVVLGLRTLTRCGSPLRGVPALELRTRCGSPLRGVPALGTRAMSCLPADVLLRSELRVPSALCSATVLRFGLPPCVAGRRALSRVELSVSLREISSSPSSAEYRLLRVDEGGGTRLPHAPVEIEVSFTTGLVFLYY